MLKLDNPITKQMCELFAELCPDPKVIKRIARYSNLELKRIDFNGNALNVWDSVIDRKSVV